MAKIEQIGISGAFLAILKSYLSNRKQCVVLDGIKSDMLSTSSMGNSEFCVGDPETCAMCTVFCVPYTGNFCPFLTQC